MRTSHNLILALFCLIGYSAVAQQAAAGYGRSIISFSPVQLSERTPTGVGIQYERPIGASGKFSWYLPVAYSFGHSDPCDASVRSRMLYAYPGIKFYPAGYRHKVSYAVGPSLALGKGTSNCNCGTEATTETNTGDMKKPAYHAVAEMGAIINNSVNVQATEHIFLGGEAGIGASWLNMENGKNLGGDVMLQMNVKVGYRF